MGKDQERHFFNDDSTIEARRQAVGGFYSIIDSRIEKYEEILFTGCKNLNVLEYGCGRGSYAFGLAKRGASVTGIDISSNAIEQAKAIAQDEGLTNCEFTVMDAEKMTFDDGTFDLVCGTGILHHLNLDIALPELARVMRSDARAVFMEPLGHNPAINFYRKKTPTYRTPDEHPLVRSDLDLVNKYFLKTAHQYFHLFSFFSLPLRNTSAFYPALRTFDHFDRILFNLIPPAKLLAWYMILVVSQPKLNDL